MKTPRTGPASPPVGSPAPSGPETPATDPFAAERAADNLLAEKIGAAGGAAPTPTETSAGPADLAGLTEGSNVILDAGQTLGPEKVTQGTATDVVRDAVRPAIGPGGEVRSATIEQERVRAPGLGAHRAARRYPSDLTNGGSLPATNRVLPDGERVQLTSRQPDNEERTFTATSRIVYDAGTDSVRVGTNVAYAAIQQLGGDIDMPARRQTIYQRYDAKTDKLDQRFVKKRASTFARDVEVKAHKIRIPARPYLGLDEADRTEIVAIVADFLGGGSAAVTAS